MDLSELANHYWFLKQEAEKVGLEQKVKEYSAIWSALDRADSYKQYAEVHLPIDKIINWKPFFENSSFAWPPFKWYKGDETLLNAIWFWLTDRFNWMWNCSPGFPEFFKRVYRNVKIVLLWYLSPWFRIRYWFITSFEDFNGGKPLDGTINWTCLRNRKADTVYYELKFCGFHYTLKRWRWLREGETEGENSFIEGFILAFDSSKTDEEKRKEVKSIKKVEEKVCSGWVFGWKSFVRQFNKIVELTPDLEWTKTLTW